MVQGLSSEDLNKRKSRNILTLNGHFSTFVIETIVGILIQVMVQKNELISGSTFYVPLVIVFSTLQTVSFFLASPELKRFYFTGPPT